LSGGIDSALAARLAADALGPKHVLGLLLPDASFPSALLTETREYAATLGVGVEERSVGGVAQATRTAVGEFADRVAAGNATARIRMMLLYDAARRTRRLVMGTGNKSELLLGYFTKYGDGGADLLPLGDLYKTEVRELATRLALPASFRERVPTAGFWEGQTDEGELGLPYEAIDQVLLGLESLLTEAEIADQTGIPRHRVDSIADRVRGMRHKRRGPPIPKLRLRTVGIDWKE
jgi:NAD+ synthase